MARLIAPMVSDSVPPPASFFLGMRRIRNCLYCQAEELYQDTVTLRGMSRTLLHTDMLLSVLKSPFGCKAASIRKQQQQKENPMRTNGATVFVCKVKAKPFALLCLTTCQTVLRLLHQERMKSTNTINSI